MLRGWGRGDKLTMVNGEKYSAEGLSKAVREAKGSTAAITLTAERNGESQTFSVNYHGGEKYVAIVRNGRPDLLTGEILGAR